MPDTPRGSAATPEQVVLQALEELAGEHNYPGGDLDLVRPELAAPRVVAALREAGMLNG